MRSFIQSEISTACENTRNTIYMLSILTSSTGHIIIIEGVRARVSQPSFYNSLPVCSFRTLFEGKSARVVN